MSFQVTIQIYPNLTEKARVHQLGRHTRVQYARTRHATMDAFAYASMTDFFFFFSFFDSARYHLIWSKTGWNRPRIDPIWAEKSVKKKVKNLVKTQHFDILILKKKP